MGGQRRWAALLLLLLSSAQVRADTDGMDMAGKMQLPGATGLWGGNCAPIQAKAGRGGRVLQGLLLLFLLLAVSDGCFLLLLLLLL